MSTVTTRLPPDACPACGKLVDSLTGRARPHPGDIALCFGCGAANEVGADFRLRPLDESTLNAEEADELALNRVMLEIVRGRT